MVTLKEKINKIVEEALEKAIHEKALPEGDYPSVKIEYPREAKFGDYATPVAMESARIVRRSPVDIGAILKPYIESSSLIGNVEVVKPGFINMFIDNSYFLETLKGILNERGSYGRRTARAPQTINIEFVSANPTGPMNVVSARAAALGDTIANLKEAMGHTVEREFYVNDYGNQFKLLGRSVLSRIKELKEFDVSFPEDGYHGEYIYDIARHIISSFPELDLSREENELIDFCAREAVEYNVESQKKDLGDFNVTFHRWFRERDLHENGKVEKTWKFLEERNVVFEDEGKVFFKSTDYGDDKDRVIVRDDGRPTYLLADIAYHRDKIDRGYDKIIDIWGPDHHGYIARLSGAVKAMGFPEDRFDVLIAQQVNLVMEGETVKMSKRLGRFSTMRELLDEIGVDVARYFFIMRSMESHLDFDLGLAKKQSSENPVFYLQYAHARICSLFREAEKRGFRYTGEVIQSQHLQNEETETLLKLMVKYPEEVEDAATSIEPHKIPVFLMRLAQAYHRFYTEHRIITDDTGKTLTFLALCDAVRTVMKNGLTLLGVSAPERM